MYKAFNYTLTLNVVLSAIKSALVYQAMNRRSDLFLPIHIDRQIIFTCYLLVMNLLRIITDDVAANLEDSTFLPKGLSGIFDEKTLNAFFV